MKIKDVVALKEVADDLSDGKAFYDRIEAGAGDYFWDSLVAGIESLIIYAGIHNKRHGLHRMLAKQPELLLSIRTSGNMAFYSN